MAYEVLARKWRPQQFSDVVGQEHVTRTLVNAIEQERVAHAYMFVGSRGTGKTTTARILAKALTCEKGPSPIPCDTCDACREVMAGNSLDVIEIDGASNNNVDQVRDLRDNARYAPTRGQYKIYIIDEVHMLSTAAFNALLKTLEEPPAHVKFIFATTDVHKVLPTILSRCQRFDLRRISIQDIVGRLRKGCEEEGIKITEDALIAIARGAEGGLRDAESALDQLISFRGKDITEEDVLAVFGLVSRERLEQVSTAILTNNVAGIMSLIAQMDQAGKDLQRIVMELLDLYRNLLVVSYGDDAASALELPESQLASLQAQVKQTDAGRILRVIDGLVETDGRMRYALSKRTLLETGLIRCARAAETVTLNELMAEIATLKKKGYSLTETAPLQVEEEMQPTKKPESKPDEPILEAKPAESKPVEEVPDVPAEPVVEVPIERSHNQITVDVQALITDWPHITDAAAKADSLSKSYLHDTVPIALENNILVIGYDPEFASEVERFKEHRLQIALSRSIEKKIGQKFQLQFRPLVGENPQVLPTDHSIEEPMPIALSAELDQVEYEHPVVKEVVEIFNGRITDIRT
jgi:DNA polymerase-3 subunit gamma/tau